MKCAMLHNVITKKRWNYLNTSELIMSCLHFIGVLFSVRMLISNRTWVSSFIISSKQTTVFFWQSIGAASVDRRIWKVTERARNSQAEPGGKKSLCGVKSFQLYKWSYKKECRVTEWKKQQTNNLRNYGCLWLRFCIYILKSGFQV